MNFVASLYHFSDKVLYNHIRKHLIKFLFKYHIHLDYPCAEFGVYKGVTARYITKYSGDRTLYLFDSFKGLPEDWHKFKKGHFSLDNIPPLPEKAILYQGWFEDTIPHFTDRNTYALSFIHIDSDLQSSAVCILNNLNSLIIPGTVILFDEYLRGEDKAFMDWQNKFNRTAIMIERTIHLQVAYKVIR